MRSSAMTALVSLLVACAACASSRNLPHVRSGVRPVGAGRSLGETEQWNEAHEELDALTDACESERSRLEHEADEGDRARRLTTAAAIGASVAGQTAERGETGSEVSVGDARCTPVAGPNLTLAPGQPGYTVGCRSAAAGGGGPIIGASEARMSAEDRIAAMQRALDEAYDWLASRRDAVEWSEEDEAEWHEQELSLDALCRS